MSTYSFKVTKGKFELTLSTTDQDLVIEQFEKWVRAAAAVSKKTATDNQSATNNMSRTISDAAKLTQRKVEEQLKRIPVPEYKENKQVTKAQIEENERNLDVFYSPQNNQEQESENSSAQTSQGVFDSILDKSMQIPQTELSFKPSPSIKKDNAFLNYISGRKVERKIDYLLMTAYYFTQFEQKPRFTLKQLNAKLMQNIAIILDHSVIQEAVNRDYIECLPDLTGVVGSSEYRLTAYGEKTLLEEG